MLLNNLWKIDSDRVGEQAEDNNVHPGPHRIVGDSIVGENVVDEGVLYQGHQHQVTLDGVVSSTMFTVMCHP
jgi:hypothetical protein